MSTLQEHSQPLQDARLLRVMDGRGLVNCRIARKSKFETTRFDLHGIKDCGDSDPTIAARSLALDKNLMRDVRKPHENPSIGVLFCKSKNDEVVEIAMSRQLSPTLVTAYETKFLDKKLLQRLLHDWSEEWAQRHGNDL